ncbi:MAG: diguanylate cyclase [Pseudomonadales bacterium]|nr:diguanylate cyclase [Pseudomonadales bacterium]
MTDSHRLLASVLDNAVWCWDCSYNLTWHNDRFDALVLSIAQAEWLRAKLASLDGSQVQLFLLDHRGQPQPHQVRILSLEELSSPDRWMFVAEPSVPALHPLDIINQHLVSTVREKDRAVHELQQTATQLAAIIAFQSQLAQVELDLARFSNLVVERLCQLTSASSASVQLLHGDNLITTAAGGDDVNLHQPQPLTGSLAESCLISGNLTLCEDVFNDPRAHKETLPPDAHSVVLAPVFHGGQAVGVVRLMTVQPQYLTSHDLQTLQLMAGMLGSALAHQRDFELSTQLIDQRTTALHDLRQEVHRRELSEQALLASMERTQAILETSQEGFLSFDSSLCITGLNAEAALLLGGKKADLLGYNMSEGILTDPFLSRLRMGITQFKKHGRWPWLKRRLELPLYNLKHQRFMAEISFSATGVDNFLEFHAFLHDITARKRTEDELNLRQNMLRSVTDNLPALASCIDLALCYTYVNERCRHILNLGSADISGRPARELIGADAPPAIATCFHEAKDKGLARTEASLATHAGLRRHEFRCIAQRNINGQTEGVYVIAWDIEERWQEEQRLRDAAARDPLTGAFNRQGFLHELEQLLNQRPLPRHALMYLDLDTFKTINDVHGHASGDEVLKVFTARLRACVREQDAICRIGGDEFLILLRHIGSHAPAERIANDILIATREPMAIQGLRLTMSTSIGIALHEGENSSALIDRADAALYRAKAAGRNGYRRA